MAPGLGLYTWISDPLERLGTKYIMLINLEKSSILEVMNYILAISGGVDSVVLLDMLADKNPASKLIVAHFDHGIRTESGDDAAFVRRLAGSYGLEYCEGRAQLGVGASEETARMARYKFLYELANRHDSVIVTAHHLDDLVESVAINLHRGTGWRGLAVMSRSGIVRPLLAMTKQEIYDHALSHRLEWVEDATNRDMRYLRNRLRRSITHLPHETKLQIAGLRDSQMKLAELVEGETAAFSSLDAQPRHLYIMADHAAARELLRAYFVSHQLPTPTQPQLDRLLAAIKTARPGSRHDVAGGIFARFDRREFVVLTSDK